MNDAGADDRADTELLVPPSFRGGYYLDPAYQRNGKENGAVLQQSEPPNGELNGYSKPEGSKPTDSPQRVEPLPFTLPTLTAEQKSRLSAGERVQEQSKMGREGSGYVVMDIKAPADVIWDCLLDFEAYPENIGTVRSMRMFTNTHLASSYIAEQAVSPGTDRENRRYGKSSVTRASFVLSKFQLKIAAVHKYQPHPKGDYMVFTLDKACTNPVLQDAQGTWHTQTNPDGKGDDVTRVWLLCRVKVSSLLPSFIVDYTANRAMPRATTWLPPLAEAAAQKRRQRVNGSS
jgi:Polyketide cyclase / dehydrase and lipid transport